MVTEFVQMDAEVTERKPCVFDIRQVVVASPVTSTEDGRGNRIVPSYWERLKTNLYRSLYF
jgi:hypothetical protein